METPSTLQLGMATGFTRVGQLTNTLLLFFSIAVRVASKSNGWMTRMPWGSSPACLQVGSCGARVLLPHTLLLCTSNLSICKACSVVALLCKTNRFLIGLGNYHGICCIESHCIAGSAFVTSVFIVESWSGLSWEGPVKAIWSNCAAMNRGTSSSKCSEPRPA